MALDSDTNLVLLFLTGGFCFVLIARCLLARRRALRSWIWVASGVLLITSLSFFWAPDIAGYVGAGLCALFLMAPLQANNWAYKVGARRRFGFARVLARLAITLHPAPAVRGTLEYLSVLEGREHAATQSSAAPDLSTAFGRIAYVKALLRAYDFSELLEFTRALPREIVRSEAWIAFNHVVALGALGHFEDMLRDYAEFERTPALAGIREQLKLAVAARLGRVDLVERLLAGPLGATMDESVAKTWHARTRQIAGDATATAVLDQLAGDPNPDVQRSALRSLQSPVRPIALSELSPEAQAIAAELAREVESAAGLDSRGHRAPATWLLLGLLTAVFGLELYKGSSTDLSVLIDLGALVIPPLPGADSPLRLLSAAFLHVGALHFVMNALGLWMLGRQLEGALGAWRTFAVFIVSALFGNLVARYVLSGPIVLLGASGGVLGLLGALLAIALRRRMLGGTRFLRKQLSEIGLIILLQAVFDIAVPHVSSTVHAAGAGAGFLFTLALSWRRVL